MIKLVINGSFGGYGCGVAEQFKDFVEQYENESERFSPELIQFVEEHPNECGDLIVVGLPEGFTDYYIDEYDGAESVLYVFDGKIYWAEEIED